MDEKGFLIQCKELVEYARAKESKLTEKEIKEYFDEMKLTKEQFKAVYAYLMGQNIHIKEVSGIKEKEDSLSETDSIYLKVYQRDIGRLPVRSKEEMDEWCEGVKNGDRGVVDKVVESHLKRVVTIARKYKNRGVLLEDLIQEGNLELVSCVNGLLGKKKIKSVKKEIDRAVKSCMISLVDEAMEDLGREHTILAKVNLIHEATRVLAEENGTIGNIHELAEYTKMNETEILEMIELSLDEIELGECDCHEQ